MHFFTTNQHHIMHNKSRHFKVFQLKKKLRPATFLYYSLKALKSWISKVQTAYVYISNPCFTEGLHTYILVQLDWRSNPMTSASWTERFIQLRLLRPLSHQGFNFIPLRHCIPLNYMGRLQCALLVFNADFLLRCLAMYGDGIYFYAYINVTTIQGN